MHYSAIYFQRLKIRDFKTWVREKVSLRLWKNYNYEYSVRAQDICDKEIKNKKELCYNASDQTNKITGDPSYETYYNRRTETS